MISTNALRSEALNVRSTLTARLLLVGSMVMAAVSLLANLSVLDDVELAATSSIERLMHSSTVATMTLAFVAGLVSATTDYRFGRTDQMLLTEPRPAALMASKTVVGSIVGVLYGIAGSVVAVVVMGIWYRVSDVTIDLTSASVVRPLIGVILAAALFVAMGIGLGSAVRNQPAAIAGGLALLLIVQPPMLLGLPGVGRWLPGAAGLSLTRAPDPNLLGQLSGGVVLVAWALLALVAGTRRLATTGS